MRWDDDDPGLPIKFGPCANDEYPPVPLSPLARETVRRARAACDDNARRAGLSRRQFLLSVCGAATTLLVLDACSKDRARKAGQRPGGTFDIPKEGTTEPDAARTAISGEEVIFDVQGHLLDYSVDAASRAQSFGAGFPQAQCGEADPKDCFSTAHFLEEIFLRSDTSMVVVSAIPVAPEHSPESIAVRERARQVAHTLCHDDRVLVQGEAHPTLSPLAAELDGMEVMARQHQLAAWKVYTHAPGPGWWLDDHDRSAPQVGEAFIRKVADLGIPRICVHKGIGGGNPFSSPQDIGPAARKHRDVAFVVYHSGWEPGAGEGPYVEGPGGKGVDRLITSMRTAGIGPNENVYAELGSTWWNLMRSPTAAAHVLGKVLRYVGQDNVLWGTDSIWYGSPQDQIQAFRAFEISAELQERHGYPALTKELKAKVLGGNALRLHGLQPIRGKCQFSRADLEALRVAMPGGHRTYGPSA
jgi:uncharacterized protein